MDNKISDEEIFENLKRRVEKYPELELIFCKNYHIKQNGLLKRTYENIDCLAAFVDGYEFGNETGINSAIHYLRALMEKKFS